MEPNSLRMLMEFDFDTTAVGTSLLILGLAYLLSGLVFLLPNPEGNSDDITRRSDL
jgi:hypothetical protein